MSELADLFHSEAAEYLQLLNDSLLELERDGGGEEARAHLDEMFRAAHSLKGMSATMGYTGLARLTHRMEDLLDMIRRGEAEMTPAIADLLFEGLDALEAMLANPEGAEPDPELMERFAEALKEREKAASSGGAARQARSAETGREGAQGAAPAAGGGKAVSAAGYGGAGAGARARAAGDAGIPAAADLGHGFQPGWRLLVTMADQAPMKSVRGHIVLRALENEPRVTIVGYRPDPVQDPDEAFDAGMEIFIRTDLPPEAVAERLRGIPDVEKVEPSPWNPAEAAAGHAGDGGYGAGGGDRREGDAGRAGGDGRGGDDAATSARAPLRGAGPGSSKPAPKAGAADAGAPAAPSSSGGSPSARTGQEGRQAGAARSAMTQIAPDRIVRVDTEQLDALVNLVGELVIYRVRLMQVTAELRHENGALAEAVEHIDRITDSLQHAIMSLRMVPVSQVFNRFPRVVRDIARQLGKQVEFITQGEDTELDRSIVHQLGDPLVHLVRNAVDHGLEPPEERIALGKPPAGRLELSARHQGNHVVIEVTDDGRGIDPDKIAAVALKKGLLTQEELDVLTPAQKLQLIFRPGFSTAEKVTDVSGRGVGMDAVRNVMESLNGQVEVWSEPGRGTRVTLRLPLTLAIIPALLVRCGTEIYALPLEYVVQNLRLSPKDIHTIQGYPHIRWRDSILGVRSLAQLMRLPADRMKGPDGAANGRNGEASGRPAVVVDVGSRQAVLEVDEIIGQQEIVIKNLGGLVGDIRGVAGATVLGDGRVALIVDLPAFMENN